MRDFNQAAPRRSSAEISANLTPEQAVHFQRTAKQRIADSGTAFTDGSVDGAFELIGFLAESGSVQPDFLTRSPPHSPLSTPARSTSDRFQAPIWRDKLETPSPERWAVLVECSAASAA